ncbi:MAG TPA: NUDIX domain-containing protein [Anaerolineales bacterium]|jgi:8-oxo-dGTP pyrophosphatase MutT (NUDIX family)|nr:NUDIX domain-containing protein [Anaerolineales bacterium]
MRIRAGIVLIQDHKVALIERHRAGLDYFVFPGGGVEKGESLEQAAVREAMEELGVEIVLRQKVAEVRVGQTSRHIYFLVEQIGGKFGAGVGEEYTDSDPQSPEEGIYIPIWMPIAELLDHQNIYPADVARLVVRSVREGWAESASFEEP